MKSIKTVILVIALMMSVISFGQKSNVANINAKQSYIEHSPTAHHEIALEVLNASKSWINNFNQGNSIACSNRYQIGASMRAMPFGLKNGIDEISEFWTQFIKSGASNLIYTNTSIEVVDDKTVFLSANWSMNVGEGIIYHEKWEKIDGNWMFTYDDFEVLKQYKMPKENKMNPVGSHEKLEQVIKASIEFTNGFNIQNIDLCGKYYTQDAKLNATPFASIIGQEKIKSFWKQLSTDGAKNLIYHNPTFKIETNNSATLNSSWSMNIGEGRIFKEKWVLENEKWVLNYDEFKILKQY